MGHIQFHEHMRNQPIYNSHTDMIRFLKEFNVETFQDISEDKLKSFYQTGQDQFWNVIRILGFLGFQFKGKLQTYSSLELKEDQFLIYTGDNNFAELNFSYRVQSFLGNFLHSFGIHRICDLHRVNLSNLSKHMENLDLSGLYENLVSELQELGFTIGFIETLQSNEIGKELKKTKKDFENNNELETTEKIIKFDNEVIVIPKSMYDQKIESAFSSSVGQNINHLIKDNIHTYGELPSNLSNYFRRRSQVGEGKIEKFKQELLNHFQTNGNPVIVKKVIELCQSKVIYVPNFLKGKSIDCFLPYIDKNASYQNFIELTRVKKITHWEQLEQYTEQELIETIQKKGIRMKNILQFLNGIHLRLDGDVSELSFDELWVDFYQTILLSLLNNKRIESITETHWDILIERLDRGTRGEGKTLQEIANNSGRVSRELIRQRLIKAIQKLIQPYLLLFHKIKEETDRAQDFVSIADLFSVSTSLSEDEGVLLNSLWKEMSLELYYEQKYGAFYSFPKENMYEDKQQFLDFLLKDKRWFYPTELEEKINTFFEKNLRSLLTIDIIKKEVIPSHFTNYQSIYFCNQGTKREKLLPIFEVFFPQGLAIIKESHRLKNIVQEICPELIEGIEDRAIYSSLLRNEEEVLIWDNGYYVPRKFITIRKEELESIKEWTVQHLKKTGVPEMRLTATLWQFKKILNQLGITNEYALYTCFRLHFSDSFDFIKAPRICLKGRREEANEPLTKVLLDYMRSHKRKVLKKEIIDKFVKGMGWELYHIDQRFGDEIIRAGFDEYIHIDNLNINLNGLETLKNWLVKKLQTVADVVSIKIVSRPIMKMANIDSHYLLYEILQREYPEVFSFYLYPKIGLFNEKEEIYFNERKSKLSLLEKKFLDENRILRRSELSSYFKSIGWDNNDFSLISNRSENLLVYNQGFAYVHKASLGLDDKKKEAFLSVIDKVFEKEYMNNRCFLDVEKISKNYEFLAKLPKLNNDIEWSPDLMISVMKWEPERYVILGSTDKLAVQVNNSEEISNDTDFIGYILKTECNGAASLKAIEQRLIKLNFIKKQFNKIHLNHGKDQDISYITTETEIMTHEVFNQKG
ncbi:hypothetical protein [Priestia aryabhattai]|uniref:hypothetical protein n=1 Tax=Priestia aryabhattai TaxID=412384 RepID=UPI001ADA8754|nr:hypothetical protein [Priestia aryabhattai]QTL47339.1 hypothetical protein J5Z55_14670 [Priestia aryabhattai]